MKIIKIIKYNNEVRYSGGVIRLACLARIHEIHQLTYKINMSLEQNTKTRIFFGLAIKYGIISWAMTLESV